MGRRTGDILLHLAWFFENNAGCPSCCRLSFCVLLYYQESSFLLGDFAVFNHHSKKADTHDAGSCRPSTPPDPPEAAYRSDTAFSLLLRPCSSSVAFLICGHVQSVGVHSFRSFLVTCIVGHTAPYRAPDDDETPLFLGFAESCSTGSKSPLCPLLQLSLGANSQFPVTLCLLPFLHWLPNCPGAEASSCPPDTPSLHPPLRLKKERGPFVHAEKNHLLVSDFPEPLLTFACAFLDLLAELVRPLLLLRLPRLSSWACAFRRVARVRRSPVCRRVQDAAWRRNST